LGGGRRGDRAGRARRRDDGARGRLARAVHARLRAAQRERGGRAARAAVRAPAARARRRAVLRAARLDRRRGRGRRRFTNRRASRPRAQVMASEGLLANPALFCRNVDAGGAYVGARRLAREYLALAGATGAHPADARGHVYPGVRLGARRGSIPRRASRKYTVPRRAPRQRPLGLQAPARGPQGAAGRAPRAEHRERPRGRGRGRGHAGPGRPAWRPGGAAPHAGVFGRCLLVLAAPRGDGRAAAAGRCSGGRAPRSQVAQGAAPGGRGEEAEGCCRCGVSRRGRGRN